MEQMASFIAELDASAHAPRTRRMCTYCTILYMLSDSIKYNHESHVKVM